MKITLLLCIFTNSAICLVNAIEVKTSELPSSLLNAYYLSYSKAFGVEIDHKLIMSKSTELYDKDNSVAVINIHNDELSVTKIKCYKNESFYSLRSNYNAEVNYYGYIPIDEPNPKNFHPRNDSSSSMLTPIIHIELLSQMYEHSKNTINSDKGSWSYTCSIETSNLSIYKTTFMLLNSSIYYEYFPELGFYRWSTAPYSYKWNYVKWVNTNPKE